MPWEKRRGRGAYYTRSVRRDGRRVREYIGGGQAGVLAAAQDIQRRAERRAGAEARRQEQARCRAVDGLVLQLFELAGLIADAALVTGGYYKHGGEWRRNHGRRDRTEAR